MKCKTRIWKGFRSGLRKKPLTYPGYEISQFYPSKFPIPAPPYSETNGEQGERVSEKHLSRFIALCYQCDIRSVNNRHSKDAATNPRGIPYAPFVDRVEDYVSSRAEVDGTMRSFQEMISYEEQATNTTLPSPLSPLPPPPYHLIAYLGAAQSLIGALLAIENTNSWRPTPSGERPA